jgi:DNA-binding NtrC family response regulator
MLRSASYAGHSQEPSTKNKEPGTYTPVWIQTLNHLLSDDAAGALRLARLEAKRLMASIFGTGFGALNLIRAELASGNAEAASRLLDMRASRGNAHYLDPLFRARCALLSDRKQEAAEQFQAAQAAAQHYDAAGRLEFELLLALELRRGEVSLGPAELANVFLATDHPPRTIATPPPAPRETAMPGSKRLVPRLKAKPAPPATDDPRLPQIIGRSPAILKLRETILQMASQDVPVLITGETGTGKEVVASALHTAGNRANKPFIAVNCSAISETLLESELFGHERGSFTGADRTTGGLFEDAGEGTLLLDEIGDVSPRLQAVLLRVLETGEIRAIGSSQSRKVRCRILAATNADLEACVAAGSFRQDLLYRLQRLTIHVSPLRERREDIMPLVRHFLDEGRPVGTHASVSPTFVETARQYDWPGNVRELRNVIERMRLTHSDKLTYTEADLDIKNPAPRPKPVRIPLPGSGGEAGYDTLADGRGGTRPSMEYADGRGGTRPSMEYADGRGGTRPSREYADGRGGTRPSGNTPPGWNPSLQEYPDGVEPVPPPAQQTGWNPSLHVQADGAEIAHFLQHGNSALRRLERLKAMFAEHGKLTRSEIVHILGISPNTATKYLKALCDDGIIRRVEPSASPRTHYFEQIM